MGKEQLLELNLPPAPPEEPANEEIAFAQIFSQAVDALFSQQPIANAFKNTGVPEEEIEKFVRERKQKLFLELIETARLEMIRFLVDLNEKKGIGLEVSADQPGQAGMDE